MKKLVVLIWLLVLGAALVSPVAVKFVSTGVSVNWSTVGAVRCCGGGGTPTPKPKPSPSPTTQTCAKDASGKCSNLLQAKPCVQVALPIVAGGSTCVNNNPAAGGAIVVYLREVLQLMSAAVGIIILLMLVVAGIQYITSTGNPSLVGAAKKRIINALTALFLFMFMTLILQFIVPGGVL